MRYDLGDQYDIGNSPLHSASTFRLNVEVLLLEMWNFVRS